MNDPTTTGLLALDCGQSHLSWRLDDATGSLPGVDTSGPVLPQIADAVRAILTATGGTPSAVGAGASGLDRPDAAELLGLLEGTSITEAAMAHDSITCYLGALGANPGVVTACGTGVVTLGVGRDEVAKVDGWGYLMGDAGSAFWIGRNALEAAMRGYDGRRQKTALTEVVEADFDDIEVAYLELQADPNRVSRVASYAVVVDTLSSTDPVARNILDKAAAHLAEAVVAAAHRVALGNGAAPAVCALGRTFDSDRLRHRFIEFLTMNWPDFALQEPRGDALAGAGLLVGLTSGPLAAKVSRARL